jgi:peptidoglycan/xylan/chitin deacetylase (PgdA/CDA1 family)
LSFDSRRLLLALLLTVLATHALAAVPAHDSSPASSPDPALIGVRALMAGDSATARTYFSAALSRDAYRAIAVAGLAAVHLANGEVEPAVSSLLAATRLAPDQAWPDACLGAAYLQRGDWREATDALRKALTRRPAWAAARSRLAFALLRQGLPAPAADNAHTAANFGDAAFAPFVEAAALLQMGDNAGAVKLACATMPCSPTDGSAPTLFRTPLIAALEAPAQRPVVSTPPPTPTTSSSQPGLRITFPRDGATVEGAVEIRLTSEVTFAYSALYVDDQFLAVSNLAHPQESWDTTHWSDGAHRLRADAYDDSGREISRQDITVVVRNRDRTGDAAQTARDAGLGRALAEWCMPSLAPWDVYLLRSRAARAAGDGALALEAAEAGFAYWPWQAPLRAELQRTNADLGIGLDRPAEIHVLPPGRMVAVTFDDGPHPRLTPWLLDVLARRGITATFFLVGKQAAEYPDLVRAIVARGHEIGSHSQTHNDLSRMSRLDVERELVESRLRLAQASGRQVMLFRPPGGNYSDDVRDVATNLGFRTVFWTSDIAAYAGIPPDRIVRGMLHDLKNGGILLLHNGEDETPQVVEDLLDRLQATGYRLGPVSKLLGIDSPYLTLTGAGVSRP